MFYNREWTFLTQQEFLPIRESFELKNLKKVQAMNMNMWGWQKLPDLIKHHRVWKDWLIKVPVGVRSVWNNRFTNNYWDIVSVNHPQLINPFKWEEDLDLTDKQNKAIEELLQRDVWLLWASTGTWKTSVISKIIDRLKCKTLIVCCNLELMNQMRDDLEMFFWVKYPCLKWWTFIREQVVINKKELDEYNKYEDNFDNLIYWFAKENWEKKAIEILKQSDNWYSDRWDFVRYIEVLNEEWYFTNEQINKINKYIEELCLLEQKIKYKEVLKIGNKKLLKSINETWVTIANIDSIAKAPFDFLQQFDLVLFDEVDKYLWADNRIDFLFNCPMKYQYWLTGTIKVNHVDDKIFKVYFWHRVELLLKHFQPNIYKVLTDFEYILDDIKDFHELKAALYENDDRNELIIQTIIDTIDWRKGIVFCEYVEHSRVICDMLEKKWIKTFMLIWEVKKEDRARIKQELKDYKWPCCLVGSVKIVGRGFSVPELSVGYLTTAEKFSSNIEQYLWRVCRLFPWKNSCDWFDFLDTWCNILANQAKARHTQYKKAYPNSKINFYN